MLIVAGVISTCQISSIPFLGNVSRLRMGANAFYGCMRGQQLIVLLLHQIYSFPDFYMFRSITGQCHWLWILDFVLCFSRHSLFPAICLSTCIAFYSATPLLLPWLRPGLKQALAHRLLELLVLEYLSVITKLILIQQVLLLLCFC